MRIFEHEKKIQVSSDFAWIALKEFNQWITEISTVSEIIYDPQKVFFIEDNKYKIITPEGPTMNCCIKMIIENQKVRLNARYILLKSELECEVVKEREYCKIIRRQKYLGIVGCIFSFIANKREGDEVKEYLNAWENYSKKLVSRHER